MYLVATPIGNLADITLRALAVLGRADLLLAEDTRVSRRLLDHHGIRQNLQTLHQHNEHERAAALVERILARRLAAALIADAGTPLLSDPGYPLVRAAHAMQLTVRALPGPSAALAALCVSGLPTDRFAFEGFLPSKAAARLGRLRELAREDRTLLFYEAPHRLLATIADMQAVFGAEREVCVARELTKLHETLYRGRLADVAVALAADPHASRGELVVAVAPATPVECDRDAARRLLVRLLAHMSARDAVEIAAEQTGTPRNLLYALVLELKGGKSLQ